MFEVKVSYDKPLESGDIKSTKEKYIVDAMSVTEAEAKTLEELSIYSEYSLSVLEVKKYNVKEVIYNENEVETSFFKVKVSFITIDENSGKEKKQKFPLLVNSISVDDAVKVIHSEFKDSLTDYEIDSVNSTNIVGYIKD